MIDSNSFRVWQQQGGFKVEQAGKLFQQMDECIDCVSQIKKKILEENRFNDNLFFATKEVKFL
jgi:hypothetical protein